MIVSLSGYSGSGKDLVGKIWQCLTSSDDDVYDELFKNPKNVLSIHENPMKHWGASQVEGSTDYEIKKFATAPKEIACLILGCKMEDWEDRDFKEDVLGEEWWSWDNGHSGLLSYKDFPENSFPNGLTPSKLNKPTRRDVLKLLATDFGRNILHPDIWLNMLMSQYKEGDCWIITDTRFPNELRAVKERGGVTIRILREGVLAGTHESDTALDNATFDYTIYNNGSIEDLIISVQKIYRELYDIGLPF